MSKSTPSLLALLGLVAFAGFQNRDRISDMLEDARQNRQAGGSSPDPEQGGFLSEIGQMFKSGQFFPNRLSSSGLSGAEGSGSGMETPGISTSGGLSTSLSGALRDLQDRFKANGQGDAAESWISNQANRPLALGEMEAALGHETLDELAHKTGLSRQELLLRLNAALPEVVNRLTPNGRLPSDSDMPTAL